MKEYEVMIILKPELQGDALQLCVKGALDIIKKHQYEVENVDEWGRRPLAYGMAKKREGFFCLVSFKGEPENISKINREFFLNENILRAFVTVRHKEKAKTQGD